MDPTLVDTKAGNTVPLYSMVLRNTLSARHPKPDARLRSRFMSGSIPFYRRPRARSVDILSEI